MNENQELPAPLAVAEARVAATWYGPADLPPLYQAPSGQLLSKLVLGVEVGAQEALLYYCDEKGNWMQAWFESNYVKLAKWCFRPDPAVPLQVGVAPAAPLVDSELAELIDALRNVEEADETHAREMTSYSADRWCFADSKARIIAYDALPGVLARLAVAEARPTLLPADIQPAILLAQAQIALRKACATLDRLMPLCLKKMDGDELESYWSAYHEAGNVADAIKPVVEAAKLKDAELIAAKTGKGGQRDQ